MMDSAVRTRFSGAAIVCLLFVVFSSGCSVGLSGGASTTLPVESEHQTHAMDTLTSAQPFVEAMCSYHGDPVEPPLRVQDFTLPSSFGWDLSFSALKGSWRVIFFGYLHCPDFCPLTLADFKQVKEALGEDGYGVRFVYVSIDSARDDSRALRDYLDNFDPEFIGFSGDDETLNRIQPDYGFYYKRSLKDEPGALLEVEHSARSYLVDPLGYLRASFPYHLDPKAMADAIRWHQQQYESEHP